VVETGLLDALPADLAAARLLVVNHPGEQGTASSVLTGRGAAEVVESDRPGELVAEHEGSFGFVVCRDVLRASPFPMALLAALWRLAAPEAPLLLEAEIDPEPAHSGYARFVPTAGSGAGWVPGALTLRWMVEASGFDVEHWLGDLPGAGSPARLRAVRAEREPVRSAP